MDCHLGSFFIVIFRRLGTDKMLLMSFIGVARGGAKGPWLPPETKSKLNINKIKARTFCASGAFSVIVVDFEQLYVYVDEGRGVGHGFRNSFPSKFY